ncbi:hypothetical protein CER19_13825 [Pseudomonas sp. GL93]|uniref:hypothetical protein n=1 Tax=Pseudomonas sp. GL93 TaxID=2014741 RepID=UPI000E3A8B2F|nr:hypothetical protein [Pseudomonas sp. GL93]RFD28464.1 hypothetical protein CER19_13825 [Pseudomonas sp. GL93]
MNIQNHLFVTFLMVNAVTSPAIADATTQPDGHVVAPPAQAPSVTPNRALTEMIEVWNNSDFKVYAIQQGKKTIVEPKGRMRLDNRYPVTISPVSPTGAFKFASLLGTNTKCETQYCLIVQGTENP